MGRLLFALLLAYSTVIANAQVFDPYDDDFVEMDKITCSMCNAYLKEITKQKENLDYAVKNQKSDYIFLHKAHINNFVAKACNHLLRCDKPHVLTPLQNLLIKKDYLSIVELEETTEDFDFYIQFIKKIDSYTKHTK